MALAWPLITILLMAGTACTSTVQGEHMPLIAGLDHVPIAVSDLDKAASRYQMLGFALKPGEAHENGIQNQHIKFPDGTEIELISADEPRDPLTAEYLAHQASGDGPAFIGFYAPDMNRLANHLDAYQRKYQYDDGLLTFHETDDLAYIFFGNRQLSTSDQPEHYDHRNGAEALIGIWIAAEDLAAERQLLSELGATITEKEVHVPVSLEATVARLEQAEVVFLPESQQLVQGRQIIGVTIRIRDLDTLRQVLIEASWNGSPVVHSEDGRSIFIPPSLSHGIWIEFRQESGA